MTTRADLEAAKPKVEAEISRAWELSAKPDMDRPYWLQEMDRKLDMWIMCRDQLRCIDALEGSAP